MTSLASLLSGGFPDPGQNSATAPTDAPTGNVAPAPMPLDQSGTPLSPDMGGLNPAQGGQSQQDGNGFGGKLKAALQRFAYGFGQGAMHSAGLETDAERQYRETQQQHIAVLTQQAQAQMQQMGENVMVTLKDGTQVPVPRKDYGKFITETQKASSKEHIAQINSMLAARNAGIAFDTDENGNTVLRNLAKNELPAPVQAKMDAAANKPPNEIGLIIKAQNGDKDAQTTLDTIQKRKIQQGVAAANARGRAFGAYRPMTYYDPDLGQNVTMFAGDAMNAQQQGRKLIPSGPVGANVLVAAQRLDSEAKPAIQNVRQYIGAFDDSGDRKVFARVMKENPMSEGGDAHTWMGNILDQTLKGGLSEQGKNEVVALKRLNETVGTLRATLGLPATNSATALTLQMLPGASTPDSKFAGKQLDQLEQVVNQALNVRAIGGGGNKSEQGGQPKPGGVKKFPNGKTGVWDGNGWVAQ